MREFEGNTRIVKKTRNTVIQEKNTRLVMFAAIQGRIGPGE